MHVTLVVTGSNERGLNMMYFLVACGCSYGYKKKKTLIMQYILWPRVVLHT